MKQISKLLPPAACAAGLGDLTYTEIKIAEARKPCAELVDRLCKDVGPESPGCRKVREQTPSFPVERCTAMLGSYDQVVSDLRKEVTPGKGPVVNDE